MHFKVQCNPDLKTNTMSPSSCVAANDEESSVDQQKENARTTRASNVLLSLLQPSSGISSGGPRKDFEDAANFAEVIGSMLLNGLPVVGLDDWFSLSDFMNANIQPEMRSRLMQYTAIKGRFVNLLGVRDLELGFTPNNCWTRALIQHLNETTINFHVSAVEKFTK